jgi:hypothetical protein
MPRLTLMGAVLAPLFLTVPAPAGVLPADALPLPNRLARADLVVVGKVTAIEDKIVMVAPFPGAGNQVEYRIAVVTVETALLAPRETRTVRVASQVIPPNVAIRPQPFQAPLGQEGLYFLTKQGDSGFYIVPLPLDFIDKKTASFEKDVALVQRCSKLLDDPNASLKAANPEDRFLTAAMLLAKYQTRKTPAEKTEPIDAEQSRLILRALASADWTPPTDFTQLSPRMVLGRLPLTEKDGWKPPSAQDQKAYAAYSQRWLAEHVDTYRIERYTGKNR